MTEALNQLLNHQEQLDRDGIMVGVSRQAIDEVAKELTENADEIERLRQSHHLILAEIEGAWSIAEGIEVLNKIKALSAAALPKEPTL